MLPEINIDRIGEISKSVIEQIRTPEGTKAVASLMGSLMSTPGFLLAVSLMSLQLKGNVLTGEDAEFLTGVMSLYISGFVVGITYGTSLSVDEVLAGIASASTDKKI